MCALVRVERGEERVLERRVLGGLLEVAVHLASGREDALHPGRGCRRGEVLLDHLGECRPLALAPEPPLEDDCRLVNAPIVASSTR